MVASSIPCKLSLCADREHARAGDSYVSSAIDVACPTTQNVLAIASPHELQGNSWPSSSTGTRSFCCNQQYSITAVTTSAGVIAERYAYTAHGQPTILDASASVLSSSAINNRYTYTGREWDATIALHHFRARWMSPSAGRFLSRDPIGYMDQANLYASLVDFRMLDPSGMRKMVGQVNGYPIYQYEPGDNPIPPVPGNNCFVYGQYGAVWQPCPPIPPDEPAGISFSKGLEGLYGALALLDAACEKCCKDKGCNCRQTSRDMTAALMQAWIDFYGTGPLSGQGGPGDDPCGGYMCYDWAAIFVHYLHTKANLGGCFNVQAQSGTKKGSNVVHFWVKITAGNGGPGCESFIDDGWGNGSNSNPTYPLNNPPLWIYPRYPEEIVLPRNPIDPTKPPKRKDPIKR